MNRYIMDRLMRDSRGDRQGRRENGEFASDRARNGRDSRSGGYDRRSDRSYGDYRSDRRSGRDSRNDRYYMDGNYDDYDSRRDFEYNSGELELTEQELKEWSKEMLNANGTRGARFTKEQAIQAAQNIGVDFEHFTEQEFAATLNMLYSDFCEVMHKIGFTNYDRPDIYANMAKAWLCDKDFNGEPYEKLAMYYYAIVDFEE